MQKQELVKKVAEDTNMPLSSVEKVLNSALDTIVKVMASGGFVTLRGKFIFKPVVRPSIRKILPTVGEIQTGERVSVSVKACKDVLQEVKEGKCLNGWTETPKLRG